MQVRASESIRAGPDRPGPQKPDARTRRPGPGQASAGPGARPDRPGPVCPARPVAAQVRVKRRGWREFSSLESGLDSLPLVAAVQRVHGICTQGPLGDDGVCPWAAVWGHCVEFRHLCPKVSAPPGCMHTTGATCTAAGRRGRSSSASRGSRSLGAEIPRCPASLGTRPGMRIVPVAGRAPSRRRARGAGRGWGPARGEG